MKKQILILSSIFVLLNLTSCKDKEESNKSIIKEYSNEVTFEEFKVYHEQLNSKILYKDLKIESNGYQNITEDTYKNDEVRESSNATYNTNNTIIIDFDNKIINESSSSNKVTKSSGLKGSEDTTVKKHDDYFCQPLNDEYYQFYVNNKRKSQVNFISYYIDIINRVIPLQVNDQIFSEFYIDDNLYTAVSNTGYTQNKMVIQWEFNEKEINVHIEDKQSSNRKNSDDLDVIMNSLMQLNVTYTLQDITLDLKDVSSYK